MLDSVKMNSPTPSSTPVNLLEIIEITGEAVALKLVRAFGGQTVRLPAIRNITEDHPLAQCIGIVALGAICRETGGGRWLYIAKCQRGVIEERNRAIVRDYSAGVPVSQLVKKYGPCDRQIWNILGSTVVDDRQQSFF